MIRVRVLCPGLAAMLLGSVAAPARVAGQAPPCAECVALALPAARVEALPGALNGTPVLIDVASGGVTSGLLDAVRQRGGDPGLLVPLHLASAARATAGRAATVILMVPPGEPGLLAFELKTQLAALRAAAPSARLGISATASAVSALMTRGLSDYLDVVVTPGRPASMPNVVWWRHADLVLDAASAIDATRTVPAERWVWTAPDEPGALRRLVADLARARTLLPRGLLPSGEVEVRCGPGRAETWLDPSSLDLVSWAPDCAPDRIHAPRSHRIVERIALSSGHAVVRLSGDRGDRFVDGVEVLAARQLTIGEILARHQAAVARQKARVTSLISTGTLTLTFEAPGFPAPVTITSESVIYTDEEHTDIEQRQVLLNGLAFPGRGVPRLPIIEPERVASPPLAIALTDAYRYTLAGMESIDGVRCHVVAFEPAVAGRSLFRGRAWIASDSFAMVRISATQTALRGPIVSSEQTDEFREEGEGIWLLARSDVRQVYEGAGHRTPIHRVLAIARHEINPTGFARRRATAHATAPIVLRDTPEGYRYIRQRAGGDRSADEDVVSTRSDRLRTLAGGVIIDPNISRPLPFAGLSYVDFDLFGTGTQLSGFFGGTYGQLAVAVPSVGGTRWQLGGRAFAIATGFHDRAFVDGRERYDWNVLQRPAHASAWLLRPLTPRVALRAAYELDYTRFRRAESTAASFTLPADQVAHGVRLALEGQRAGWSGSVWWNPVARSRWRPWGPPGEGSLDSDHATFQRYGATVARATVLSRGLVARIDAAWMDGRDLDRFSRYTFGAFDNRLRGYPSALIRYDRGGVLRGAIAWSAGRRLRLDGFLDNAYVRDPGFGDGFRGFTGVGAALEAPAPSGTLIALEWGFGAQGVTATGGRGTHVVRLSAYKVF